MVMVGVKRESLREREFERERERESSAKGGQREVIGMCCEEI